MSNPLDEGNAASRQSLSALMDGHASSVDVDAACAAWRDDRQGRECWHTYHLIGDVLRSDDLATRPERDAAFLEKLKRRLAEEPVVLAPTPARLPRPRWQAASVAAAAAFVTVTGALLVMRSGSPVSPADTAGAVLASGTQPEVVVVDGKLIRDAQLDRYLAAHRRVPHGSSVVVPGAVVRSVDTMAIDEK